MTTEKSMNAVDFYASINHLIETSKEGHRQDSTQVGSLCTLLLPGKYADFRSNEEKEIAAMIDSWSKSNQLPKNFFEKPFFYPFSHTQLEHLKKQCWAAKSQESSLQQAVLIESNLIRLYEDILIKP